jgi:hypothetical protein
MILTEEEAKGKRCQEAFSAAESINPGGFPTTLSVSRAMESINNAAWEARTFGGAPLNCIGSACMAWRWYTGEIAPHEGTGTHGYCGKAGKP